MPSLVESSSSPALPACYTLMDTQIENGLPCRNVTKDEMKRKRDRVLEMMVAQAWGAVDVSIESNKWIFRESYFREWKFLFNSMFKSSK